MKHLALVILTAILLALGCVVLAQPNTAPDWPYGAASGDIQRRKEYDANGDRVMSNYKRLSATPGTAPTNRCQLTCYDDNLYVSIDGNPPDPLNVGPSDCVCSGGGTNSYSSGANADCAGDNSICIGVDVGGGSSNDDAVCIGESATCNSAQSVVVGRGISDLGSSTNSIFIGYNFVVSAIANAICLAANTCDATANTFVAGSDTSPMTEVYFGKGQTSSAPTTYRISGTKASGSNVNGGTLRLQGGAGTGTGVGGDVPFYYCAAGSSGTSVNSCSTSTFYRGSDGSWHLSTGFKWIFGSSEEVSIYDDGNTSEFTIDATTRDIRLITDGTVHITGALDASGSITGSDIADFTGTITGHDALAIDGEATIGGISGDGTGKTVCIKANGALGTCTTTVNSSGVCTCS